MGMPGNNVIIPGDILHLCFQLYSWGTPEYLCIAMQKYFRDFMKHFGYKKKFCQI